MRIALTGASGFIGRSLAELLVAEGHHIYSLCRPGSTSAGTALSWDMQLGSSPPLPPEPIDVIVHLAQSRRHRDFPAHAAEMFRVNVQATAALLEWAIAVRAKRFVLVSSGSVYEPFDGRLDEASHICPASYLGATKLASEVLARPYQTKLSLSVLRLFFPYGPQQVDRLIPDLIRRVREGRPIHLAGEQGLTFVPTYVDDVAQVIATAVHQGWTDTINVASGRASTIREVSELIGMYVGQPPVFEVIGGSPAKIIPDISRLAAKVDLSRFITLEDGLRRTLK